MKAMLDLNVLLDFAQTREPHFAAALALVDAAAAAQFVAMIPAHAVTTVFYIVEKTSGLSEAERVVDWLLEYFAVGRLDEPRLHRARQLPMIDFEDGVVAALAEAEQCNFIISRDLADFAGSPVRAVAPAHFLEILAAA